jgi:mono/diheme cytochrome c family protein
VGVRSSSVGLVSLAALAASLGACGRHGPAKDEAALADVPDKQLAHATVRNAAEDYFRDMDRGIDLSPAERDGRIMWLLWTGGNDRFWDYMVEPTFGTFDLLKIAAPDPKSLNARAHRWKSLGVVNEPCFQAPTRRDPNRFFGLWIDERKAGCAPDPFEDEKRYPGVKQGARGTTFSDGRTLPVGSLYGYPTGIVGLRLFPNPKFDEKAAKHWGDGSRYYSDPSFYNDKKLVRPYRVGMSCAFCHVGPDPSNPPADPNAPEWANLNSSVGAQYLWMDRIFYWNWEKQPDSFLYQWLKTFKPGTMDTSLVSTDNINNPRTMNALYNVPARLEMAAHIGEETLAGGGLDNVQFNDVTKDSNLTRFYNKPQILTPRVLKDGSDSVGMLGALNRVYLNIGLYSEEWMRHFNPVIGGKTVSPIKIADARSSSPYWRATEKGTPAMALFFLKAAKPDRLAEIPGGAAYVNAPPAQLARGKEVFADNCARCHSSKGPKAPQSASLAKSAGPGYLDRFKAWWRWTQTPQFKQAMRAEVAKPDFLADNYLSTDARIPVTLLRTNMCSPLATNGIRGNIWDNFTSESYKTLPAVGWASYNDPYNGERRMYRLPGGGRGYTRPPTLISLWSTAPYLLNNRVGPFNPDPSLAGRMASFDASIRQMLWPERREMDAVFGNRVGGTIDRTDETTNLFIPATFLPTFGRISTEIFQRKLGKERFDREGNLTLGPIPKGMPINALTNLRIRAEEEGEDKGQQVERVLNFGVHFVGALKDIRQRPPANDREMLLRFAPLRQDLRNLSKCRDFVVNRGHYFGTGQFVNRAGLTPDEQWWIGNEAPLSDPDKEALIAYLKTF